MKKCILILTAIIVSAFTGKIMAQDVLTATLQHGDELKVFYGTEAFKSALDNAEDGDDITLSSGTFSSSKISKAVSIHGSGYVNDPENNRFRTVLEGYLHIDLPERTSGALLEGIYNDSHTYIMNTKGLTINTCYLKSLYFGMTGSGTFKSENCLITNTKIVYIYFYGTQINLCLYNDIIGSLSYNSSASTMHVDHCIIASRGGSGNALSTVYGNFTNSIIRFPTPTPFCSAYNNIMVESSFMTSNASENIRMSDSEANDLFVSSEIGDNADILNMDYKLKSNPLTGNDGTPVGIYGGASPFTDIPGIPQIISKEIAPQSDAEGKLSMKIKVQTN